MSYRLISPTTGQSMTLLHREWEMLLVLAQRNGWTPERGDLDTYAQGGRVSRTDAAGMAAAIKRGLPDVPEFSANSLTEEEPARPRTMDELRARPGDEQGDPLAYFSGHRRRRTLRNFISWMGPGAFEVSLMPGYYPEF